MDQKYIKTNIISFQNSDKNKIRHSNYLTYNNLLKEQIRLPYNRDFGLFTEKNFGFKPKINSID